MKNTAGKSASGPAKIWRWTTVPQLDVLRISTSHWTPPHKQEKAVSSPRPRRKRSSKWKWKWKMTWKTLFFIGGEEVGVAARLLVVGGEGEGDKTAGNCLGILTSSFLFSWLISSSERESSSVIMDNYHDITNNMFIIAIIIMSITNRKKIIIIKLNLPVVSRRTESILSKASCKRRPCFRSTKAIEMTFRKTSRMRHFFSLVEQENSCLKRFQNSSRQRPAWSFVMSLEQVAVMKLSKFSSTNDKRQRLSLILSWESNDGKLDMLIVELLAGWMLDKTGVGHRGGPLLRQNHSWK